MEYKERHFSIDPGKGKKMDGCPYSTFEDGRDVKDFIIPPKGYSFKGFRFDPDASNQIYNGKLIAEYEKDTFNDILRSNLWKFLLAIGIIAVITVVVILAVNVFSKPSRPVKTPEPIIMYDTMKEKEEMLAQTSATEDTAAIVADTAKAEIKDDTKDDVVIVDLNAKEDTMKTKEPQPAADDPNVLFKQEFWTLIHQRTIMMDPYDKLYKDNKNKAEGEEFDYLRTTILKDFSSFKAWSGKLHKIPVADLESINTIKDLKNKLYEIE
jgi:hypothetical protein